MKKEKTACFIFLVFLYFTAFIHQENVYSYKKNELDIIPPSSITKSIFGYAKQFIAEIYFIKSAIFLGGINIEKQDISWASPLAYNYTQIVKIHPEFQATYYYAQAYLSGVSDHSTNQANEILNIAIKTYPNNTVYPFFQGTNTFLYLNDPLKASSIFREASLIPNAPEIFQRLAIILSAEGGDIEASLISLKLMYYKEKNELIRNRYAIEIQELEKALIVQNAINAFLLREQRYPKHLEELVPNYLDALPLIEHAFELRWRSPILSLKRPDPKRTKN